MKTSQALLVCGCFAEGLEVAFEHDDKYYHLFVREEVEGRFFDLDIHELEHIPKSVSFPVADISVGDGFLRFDLGSEVELNISLDDYFGEEGKE